jgi:hypothetical protein
MIIAPDKCTNRIPTEFGLPQTPARIWYITMNDATVVITYKRALLLVIVFLLDLHFRIHRVCCGSCLRRRTQ